MGVKALKDIAFAGIIILKAGGFMTNIEREFNELESFFHIFEQYLHDVHNVRLPKIKE